MKEDKRRIEVRPEGIVIVGEKTLNLSAFKARRTRLEGLILNLQAEQRHLEHQIKNNAKTIQQLELELTTFNSPEAIGWEQRKERELILARERKRKELLEAKQRAKTFLKEYIGEEAFKCLNKQGFIEFKGRDNRTYRINRKGTLTREGKTLCMVRPRSLPLPDFITSVLTTVKEVGRRT